MKKIPKFKTDKEAARFWESHSFQDYYGDTKEAGINFVKEHLNKEQRLRQDA